MIEAISNNKAVSEACQLFRVKQLYLFGSAVSETSIGTGDIDFVVDFDREGFEGAFDQFMGFRQELERILGQPVDLLVNKPFRNRLFQEEVDKTKQLVYAA